MSSIQTLIQHTSLIPAHPAPVNEYQAPAHSFLFGILQQAGLIAVTDDALRLSTTAYKWLSQPPELLLHDLRQTWFLAPELTWRWLLAGRRQVPLDGHWRYVVLEGVRALVASSTIAWTPTLNLFADLEARESLAVDSLAENLPKVRHARERRTRRVLRFLFQEALPCLGLVETRSQDGTLCLRPTAEGAAWLRAALDQYHHLTQPSHETAVERAVPSQELRFPPLEQPPLFVDENLHLTIGLAAPAGCTFEVAHFAQLLSPAPPARYRITQQSLEQAVAWGYCGADIIVLLARYSGSRLPRGAIARLFAWQREMTCIACEPGYRLSFAHPVVLDALRQREPFRDRTQPFASGQDVWGSQAQAKDLLRYLRRLGYIVTLSEHGMSENSPLWSLRYQALPLRQLLVILRTYQYLRQRIPGLADLGLQDLDQVLADALTSDDQAAVQRLFESHAALLEQSLSPDKQTRRHEDKEMGRQGDQKTESGGAEEESSKRTFSPALSPLCTLVQMDSLRARLQAAVEAERPLDLTYVDARARLTHRRVHPLRVETRWGQQYLVARCELRQSERWFRLDRIITVH